MVSADNKIEILEHHTRVRSGWMPVRIGGDINFSTDALRSYLVKPWLPVVFDAMLVAAAIEYADRVTLRRVGEWRRRLAVRIPVHDAEHWQSANVYSKLIDAVGFLTGDDWHFEFVPRKEAERSTGQAPLELDSQIQAVIPYSDGMDSRAVAGILTSSLGETLLRVTLGTKTKKALRRKGKVVPFTGVPYSVKSPGRWKDSSARSRGFKYALVGGIAAYLAEAQQIVMPESGQGAIGPALITVSYAYPDYRNHPLFLMRMEKLLRALLGFEVKFWLPRLWHTKAETLKEFANLAEGFDWETSKTCWYDNRNSSVNKKFRNCGVCSACMLRRMSVHAAGLREQPTAYVAVDPTASSIEEAVDPDFTRLNESFKEYALAGTLSLQNLADMSLPRHAAEVKKHGVLLGYALGSPNEGSQQSLASLLSRHALEWNSFVESLGEDSFISKWVSDLK